MSWRAPRLGCLDDDHATTATRAGMDRLVCRLGCDRRLLQLRGLGWLRRRRLGDQLARPLDRVGLAATAGQEPVVAYSVEALGQHVKHEAPYELGRCKRHGFVAVRP